MDRGVGLCCGSHLRGLCAPPPNGTSRGRWRRWWRWLCRRRADPTLRPACPVRWPTPPPAASRGCGNRTRPNASSPPPHRRTLHRRNQREIPLTGDNDEKKKSAIKQSAWIPLAVLVKGNEARLFFSGNWIKKFHRLNNVNKVQANVIHRQRERERERVRVWKTTSKLMRWQWQQFPTSPSGTWMSI